MPEILAGQCRRRHDVPVVIFDDRTLTYGELQAESQRIAAGLQARGIGRGDPVILVIGNRSEFLTIFFAIAQLGAIAVPVNVALKGESLAHVFDVTGARTAIVEAAFLPRIDATPGGLGRFAQLFALDGQEPARAPGVRPFAELLHAGDMPAAGHIAPGDPWTILFTSGTTGPAKGVTLPHQLISSAAWDVVHGVQMDAQSVFYTFNPLFHLNALIYGPMAAILAGARAVVRSVFPRESTLRDLRQAGATHWTATPFLIRALLAAPEAPDDADSALRFVLSFGLTAGEVDTFERRFDCRMVAGYGCTETGMVCPPQPAPANSCGRPGDRVDLRLVGADGLDVPAGSTGEIWVRARQPFDAMLGYYRMPEATAAAFTDGWFRTGDLGWLDPAGWLHFVDRIKESLKRRGENVSTFEVEQVLMGFPGVAAAAVVGFRPDARAEEEVRAFIELAPGSGAAFDPAALVRHCGRNLAYFMVPRFIDVVDALPRTAVGKIRKQELKGLPLQSGTFDVRAAGIEVPR